MLLRKCYIANFGKIHDFSYDFTEGMNVLCRENGWGKSTFAAFIQAMFYGLPSDNRRSRLEDSPRRKFQPWQGGPYGGYLIFEVDGKIYKAERSFGNKEAEDTFRLTDAKTHTVVSDYTENLGTELFGLDREAFARTTFLPQRKLENGKPNDSISAKLGRLADGEEEKSRYEEACEALEELRKKYIPDRKKEEKGRIAELTREKTETELRLRESQKAKTEAAVWMGRKESLQTEKMEIEQKLSEHQTEIINNQKARMIAEKRKYYRELCNEETRREQAWKAAGGKDAVVDEEQVARLCQRDRELYENSELLQHGILGKQEEKKQVGASGKKRRRMAALCFFLMIVLTAATIYLYARDKGLVQGENGTENPVVIAEAMKYIAVLAGAAVAVGLIGFGFAFAAGKKWKEYVSLTDAIGAMQTRLTECREDAEKVAKRFKEYGIEGDVPQTRRVLLETKCRECRNLTEEYESAKERRLRFEEENPLEYREGEEIIPTDPEFLRNQVLLLSQKHLELERALVKAEEQAKASETEGERETEIRERLLYLTEALETGKKEHGIVVETLRCLKEAKQRFSGRYQQKLEQSFRRYLQLLTDGDFSEGSGDESREAVLSAELGLRITAFGEEKELDYFSDGMRDLVYFCMRLALVDTLFSEETPFLLLDDPFVNLDEKKLANVRDLLEKTAKNYQIIYFVCHESRI